jgi:subtilase family serine protease
LSNGSADNGSGQTIAIVDAYNDPDIASNLSTFDSTWGLVAPPSLKVVNETGGSSLPATNSSWDIEISLDVEWAHAMAPDAKLLLVEANSSNLGDLLTGVNEARDASGVSVVSMSWGASEFSTETAYDSYFTTPSGHQGVTFVASSGDEGSDYGPEWPASSDNVLAVGGTTLDISSSSGTYGSETAWSDSTGGYSRYESKPAWQKIVQTSGVKSVPDVSYDANPSTGYYVYDSAPGASGWYEVGGTSAGAPHWAAIVAIADQDRALSGLGSLNGTSQTLPALYSLYTSATYSSAFHDVTSGSSGLYSAGADYDLVTGLGTPKVGYVVSALLNTSSSGAVNTAAATADATAMASASAKAIATPIAIAERSTPSAGTIAHIAPIIHAMPIVNLLGGQMNAPIITVAQSTNLQKIEMQLSHTTAIAPPSESTGSIGQAQLVLPHGAGEMFAQAMAIDAAAHLIPASGPEAIASSGIAMGINPVSQSENALSDDRWLFVGGAAIVIVAHGAKSRRKLTVASLPA